MIDCDRTTHNAIILTSSVLQWILLIIHLFLHSVLKKNRIPPQPRSRAFLALKPRSSLLRDWNLAQLRRYDIIFDATCPDPIRPSVHQWEHCLSTIQSTVARLTSGSHHDGSLFIRLQIGIRRDPSSPAFFFGPCNTPVVWANDRCWLTRSWRRRRRRAYHRKRTFIHLSPYNPSHG